MVVVKQEPASEENNVPSRKNSLNKKKPVEPERQISSVGSLSEDEVSTFFTPEDKFQIKWRRQQSGRKPSPQKSTSSADVKLDVSGVTNRAFSAEETGEELNLELATPETVRHQDSLASPDSGIPNHHSFDSETPDTPLENSMSTEEVLNLIDRLLLTDPGQSSTDPLDDTDKAEGTGQLQGKPKNKLVRADGFDEGTMSSSSIHKDTRIIGMPSSIDQPSTDNPEGTLTYDEHLAEESHLTLRNDFIIESVSRQPTKDEDELWTVWHNYTC